MHRRILVAAVLAATACAGGCGGHYIVTAPDHVAPPNAEAPAVVRLQRNDFFVLALPIEEAAVRLRIADGLERGAFTDELGYAGTTVPTPEAPGRYTLSVDHIDSWGDQAHGEGQVYVIDPARPAYAVDLDCLPGLLLGSADEAVEGLRRVAAAGPVIYMTRRGAEDHPSLHEALSKAGYPDGPILTWQRQRWHIVRDEKWKIPRIVVETRLVSQLGELRKTFANLATGVCDSALAAKAFAEAGMDVVLIGGAAVDVPTDVRRRESWTDLAAQGP